MAYVARRLILKYGYEITGELCKIAAKIKSINSSLKLIAGAKNKPARTALNDTKHDLQAEDSALKQLKMNIENDDYIESC